MKTRLKKFIEDHDVPVIIATAGTITMIGLYTINKIANSHEPMGLDVLKDEDDKYFFVIQLKNGTNRVFTKNAR
jgi:hypothetical protein